MIAEARSLIGIPEENMNPASSTNSRAQNSMNDGGK
jgi:hypothetical protein